MLIDDTRKRLHKEILIKLMHIQGFEYKELDYENMKFLKNSCDAIVENLIAIKTIDKVRGWK